MQIILQQAGRRFNREWIFKGLSYEFKPGNAYALLGANGSGKSTLLQAISGHLSLSEGSISYIHHERTLAVEEVYPLMSLAAPYQELIEEFTLEESIDFHFRFKPMYSGQNKETLMELLNMSKYRTKELRYFSSGMKQRLKLVLAFCSDTPLLLLDEPTVNLDEEGISWYHQLIDRFCAGRTIFIASNQEHEYKKCVAQIRLSEYKLQIS